MATKFTVSREEARPPHLLLTAGAVRNPAPLPKEQEEALRTLLLEIQVAAANRVGQEVRGVTLNLKRKVVVCQLGAATRRVTFEELEQSNDSLENVLLQANRIAQQALKQEQLPIQNLDPAGKGILGGREAFTRSNTVIADCVNNSLEDMSHLGFRFSEGREDRIGKARGVLEALGEETDRWALELVLACLPEAAASPEDVAKQADKFYEKLWKLVCDRQKAMNEEIPFWRQKHSLQGARGYVADVAALFFSSLGIADSRMEYLAFCEKYALPIKGDCLADEIIRLLSEAERHPNDFRFPPKWETRCEANENLRRRLQEILDVEFAPVEEASIETLGEDDSTSVDSASVDEPHSDVTSRASTVSEPSKWERMFYDMHAYNAEMFGQLRNERRLFWEEMAQVRREERAHVEAVICALRGSGKQEELNAALSVGLQQQLNAQIESVLSTCQSQFDRLQAGLREMEARQLAAEEASQARMDTSQRLLQASLDARRQEKEDLTAMEGRLVEALASLKEQIARLCSPAQESQVRQLSELCSQMLQVVEGFPLRAEQLMRTAATTLSQAQDLQTATTQLKALTEENALMRERVDRAADIEQELMGAQGLKARLAEIEGLLAKAREELETKNTQLGKERLVAAEKEAEARKSLEEQTERYGAAVGDLASLREQLSTLQAEKKKGKERLADLEQQLSTNRQEKEKVVERLTQAQRTLEQQNTQLQQGIAEVSKREGAAQEELRQLTAEREAQRAEQSSLQEQIAVQNRAFADLTEKRDSLALELERQLRPSQEAKAALEAALAALEQQLLESKKQKDAAERLLVETRVALETKMAQLEEASRLAAEKESGAQQSLSQLTIQHELVKGLLERQRTEQRGLLEQLSALQTEKGTLHQRLTGLEEQFKAELETQNVRAAEDHEALFALKTAYHTVAEQLVSQETELERLQELLAISEQKMEGLPALQEQFLAARQENFFLRQSADQAEQSQTTALATLERMQQEKEALREELEKLQEELSETDFFTKLQEWKELHEKHQGEFERRLREWQQQEKEYLQRISDLEVDGGTIQTRLDVLGSLVIEKNACITQLRQEVELRDDYEVKLEDKIQELYEAAARQEILVREMRESHEANIQTMRAEIERLRSEEQKLTDLVIEKKEFQSVVLETVHQLQSSRQCRRGESPSPSGEGALLGFSQGVEKSDQKVKNSDEWIHELLDQLGRLDEEAEKIWEENKRLFKERESLQLAASEKEQQVQENLVIEEELLGRIGALSGDNESLRRQLASVQAAQEQLQGDLNVSIEEGSDHIDAVYRLGHENQRLKESLEETNEKLARTEGARQMAYRLLALQTELNSLSPTEEDRRAEVLQQLEKLCESYAE